MTMMNSPFGLDDMEALLWGPSCPMADPTELLLHRDEVTSTVGGASPLSSSSSSPLPLTSPSPPTLLLQEEKTEADLQSLPWLAANELGHTGHVGAYVGKENAFCGLDWMSERVDLSEFDLDSLMGSCSPDGPPASPEDLPSFECPMELDSLPLSTPIDLPLAPCSPARDDPPDEIPSSPPCVPDPQEELEIKSEPRSPSPPPTFTLDLGSEVDLLEGGSPPLAIEVRQSVPRIVVSLSPTRIVLLLAPKQEVVATTTTADASFPEILSSDVGCGSRTFSSSTSSISTPPSRSHTRSKPYPAIPGPQHPDFATSRHFQRENAVCCWWNPEGEEAEEDGAEQDSGNPLPPEEEDRAGGSDGRVRRAGEEEPRVGGEGGFPGQGDPVPQRPHGRGASSKEQKVSLMEPEQRTAHGVSH
ncbi:hypothetical protein UPYG_G00093950 [Umbra pygmaea]|uniref:Uncharacterized protein n=1 Tax=Umbra pygmaea TaxID=75934 RepID=A0ABD0XP94_UMBPY